MPLYEYRCEQCGEQFEVIEKFSDEPLTRHEKCGGTVHRLISAPALQFKGSGWYITDYAKPGSSADNGKPAKPEASGTTKTESSGSTPAASTSSSETKSGSSSDKK
jgi:putative FmdB family regulatory protein